MVVVFEQQPKSGNILDLPQRKDLHDLVWNGMRQILLVWFKGDWDAVQRLLLYLEDEGGLCRPLTANLFGSLSSAL